MMSGFVVSVDSAQVQNVQLVKRAADEHHVFDFWLRQPRVPEPGQVDACGLGLDQDRALDLPRVQAAVAARDVGLDAFGDEAGG